jgi:Arc/MetJ family transcription regulator
MRTTIEITDSQRAQLLKLAAERGEKGFSSLVQEALDRYLAEQGSRNDRVAAALKLEGALDLEAGDQLEASVRLIRSTWR